MAHSTRRLALPSMAALGLVAVLALAACGGAAGPEPAAGERITDPARVPTASPMQNPVLYRLQGNQVILDGGEQAAITPVAAPTPAARQTYTVEAGDTCYSIAAAQGVPLEALIRANPAACDNLRIGASLNIPAPTPTPVTGGGLTADPTVRPTPTVPRSPGGTPGTGTVYIVRAGDTCSDIAASYGVSLAQLLAHNGFGPDCPLQIGQEVKIP